MMTPMPLIYKTLFLSISTFETLPSEAPLGREPWVDSVQEDLNPTYVPCGMLQEIRQRAEQLSEQWVCAALGGEVKRYPRHLDREPEPIQVGWSKVQEELHTDAGTLSVAELVGNRCHRLLDLLGPCSARQRPRDDQLARCSERQPGEREDPMQRPVTGDRPDDHERAQRRPLRLDRQGQHAPQAQQRSEPWKHDACHRLLLPCRLPPSSGDMAERLQGS